MGKKLFLNVGGSIQKIKKMFVNVDGTLMKVKNGFVNVGGVIQKWYTAERALGSIACGEGPSNVMDYITFDTPTVNAIDKGNLTVARQSGGGCNGPTYAFCGGGVATGTRQNVIDYVQVITTTENASDRGDLTAAIKYIAGTGGDVYGFWAGGDVA